MNKVTLIIKEIKKLQEEVQNRYYEECIIEKVKEYYK